MAKKKKLVDNFQEIIDSGDFELFPSFTPKTSKPRIYVIYSFLFCYCKIDAFYVFV